MQTVATPDGPFSVIACPAGVLASGWTTDEAALRTLIHGTLRGGGADRAQWKGSVEWQGSVERQGPAGDDSAGTVTAAALAAVERYYAGDIAAIDDVPVVQQSGPFRMAAWQVLRDVAPGEPISYSEFASRCGKPSAVRAVASACAMNAAALFVPCHRVLRSDGSLGGFRYGLDVKAALLERERR